MPEMWWMYRWSQGYRFGYWLNKHTGNGEWIPRYIGRVNFLKFFWDIIRPNLDSQHNFKGQWKPFEYQNNMLVLTPGQLEPALTSLWFSLFVHVPDQPISYSEGSDSSLLTVWILLVRFQNAFMWYCTVLPWRRSSQKFSYWWSEYPASAGRMQVSIVATHWANENVTWQYDLYDRWFHLKLYSVKCKHDLGT